MFDSAKTLAKSAFEAALLAVHTVDPRPFDALPPLDEAALGKLLDPAPFDAEWAGVLSEIERDFIKGSADPHSANPGDKRAIYQLLRCLKPRRVLELGTSAGISALFAVAALSRNRRETGVAGELVTVDRVEPNESGVWRTAGLPAPPVALAAAIDPQTPVSFVEAPSAQYLADADRPFDFVYMDASTSELGVFRNLLQLPKAVGSGSWIMLHVYYPGGLAIWPEEPAIAGPWRAVERLRRSGIPIAAHPLAELPWPTKRGTRRTSLAVIHRA